MNCNHKNKPSNCTHKYGYGDSRDGESALLLCGHCKKVYCDVCGKEWSDSVVYVSYSIPAYQPWPTYVPWVTWQSYGTNGTNTTNKTYIIGDSGKPEYFIS